MTDSDDEKDAKSTTSLAQSPVLPRVRAREKLTPEVIDRICDAIARGEHKTGACAREGVTARALHYARNDDPEIEDLLCAAEALGAEYYREMVRTASAGGKATDDWRRWAWLGERLHPSVLGPPKERRDIEVTGAGGGPVAQVILTLEQARAGAATGALPGEVDDDE